MSAFAYDAEPDDDIERLFPGAALTHPLTIVSDDRLNVALETLHAVRALGGRLDAMHLTGVDGRAECRLRLTGLRPREACAHVSRLAAAPSVARVHVEHHILRARSPAAMTRTGDPA